MINEKTVAILAPDLLGNICDWPTIRQIANKYNLRVLHDSADTLGANLSGNPVGIFSDMSIQASMDHISLIVLATVALYV